MAATKRKRDADSMEEQHSKKPRKGFSVGPGNLPDGTYRRKVQKIKRNLIEKAKTKKEYAKMKQRLQEEQDGQEQSDLAKVQYEGESATASMHPERAALLEDEPAKSAQDGSPPKPNEAESGSFYHEKASRQPRPRRTRVPRFTKEEAIAAQRREEAEAREVARAEAQRQREEKLAERERYRRAMEKAKGAGKNGQRKLGRESGVLLERVRRMMAG